LFCVSDSLPSLAIYRKGGLRGTRYCPGRPISRTEVPSTLMTRRVERYRPPHIRWQLDARWLCPATPVSVPAAVYPFFGPMEVYRQPLDPLFFWKRKPGFFHVEPYTCSPIVSGLKTIKKSKVLFKPSNIKKGSTGYSGLPCEANQPMFQVRVTISIVRSDTSRSKTREISLACEATHPDTRQGRRKMYSAMMISMQDAAEEIGAPVGVEPPTFTD